jgi:hypothetical protein
MIPHRRHALLALAVALLALALARPAAATDPRVRALGDGANYFEDDTAPLAWFGALVDYPDQVVLDLGEYDHDGGGSFNARMRGAGGGATLRLDETGRWGVLGVFVQEDLPAGAPGGAINLLGARRLGAVSLGFRAMLSSHFDGANTTESWGRGESLYFHSYGLGARWDVSDAFYGDLAAEIVNTTSDAAEEELWSLPASSVWRSWGVRTRWFRALSDEVVLVPVFDYREDDRRIASAAIGAPADQHAWQSSAGLGVNLLRDPDNLILVSGEWRWGTEEHDRLRGASSGWDYDTYDLDYHEIHARVGVESRVLPWLAVRGSLQYLRLQREEDWTRGEYVADDPDRWAADSVIRVRTPITLGCALLAGPFQADLVLNGHWSDAAGTVPFGARPVATGTFSGLSVRYLF